MNKDTEILVLVKKTIQKQKWGWGWAENIFIIMKCLISKIVN